MNTLDTLIAGRAAIASPENWTRHIRKISRGDGFAYCALGALDHALGHDCDRPRNSSPAIDALALSLTPSQVQETNVHCTRIWGEDTKLDGPGLVAQFNNSHSHEEVLAVFDRAIQRQREIEDMKMAQREVERVQA